MTREKERMMKREDVLLLARWVLVQVTVKHIVTNVDLKRYLYIKCDELVDGLIDGWKRKENKPRTPLLRTLHFYRCCDTMCLQQQLCDSSTVCDRGKQANILWHINIL